MAQQAFHSFEVASGQFDLAEERALHTLALKISADPEADGQLRVLPITYAFL